MQGEAHAATRTAGNHRRARARHPGGRLGRGPYEHRSLGGHQDDGSENDDHAPTGIHETFAPPPATAMPTMSAREALDAFERRYVPIPDEVTAQLGLFTLPVGPDCGFECEHGNIVRGDMVYSSLNKLVWGFSSRVCPAGSDRPEWQCTQWDFIDANTGEYVAGLAPPPTGAVARP